MIRIHISLLVVIAFVAGCSDQSKVTEISEPPIERTVPSDVEQMFVLQNIDGDVDIDGVLEAFYHLNATATEADLPFLLASIKSPRNNFWTRELLSEPIARIGGVAALEILLQACAANERENGETDGFSSHLSELVTREPQASYKELKRLKSDPNFEHNELCDWLLEYIEAEDGKSAVEPIKYSVGDSFQGMWNYDRRNANLRMTIEEIYASSRILLATIQSDDLDNEEKEFIGTVKDDGRKIILKGIARSGSDYETVSGSSVRDFLRKGSTMEINLDDFNSGKLRGEVENGTNIYFWSKSSGE